jgi:hypothetical protein
MTQADFESLMQRVLARGREAERTGGFTTTTLTGYDKKYTKIKPDTIEAVRKIILEDRYFKKDAEQKMILLQDLLSKLNVIYGTNTTLRQTTEQTSGYYRLSDRQISLNKLSLVTFLHEFKHGLQHQRGLQNNENIARGWSVSLFKLSSLRHYDRAVARGLLFFS